MITDTKNNAPALADDDGLRGGDPIPPMLADDHSNASPAVETGVEARQGFLGKPVLMVLVGGLTLAIVAWIGVELLVY